METSWILLLLAATAMAGPAIEHDDLRTLTLGYLDGLEINEEHTKLLACVDDTIGPSWEKLVSEIKKVKSWEDKTAVLLAFVAFLEPTFASVGALTPCSSGEIGQINSRFKYWAEHAEELATRTMDNLDMIADGLRDLDEQWTATRYVEVGKLAGSLLRWIFIKA